VKDAVKKNVWPDTFKEEKTMKSKTRQQRLEEAGWFRREHKKNNRRNVK
jgi:hypothetical protein